MKGVKAAKTSIKSLRVSCRDFAALFRRTPSAISYWLAEGLPGGAKDGIPLFEGVWWGLDHKILPSGDKDRKLTAEADMAEMERDRLAGRLLSADDARAEWEKAVSTARARLLQLPRIVAVRLDASMTVGEREAMVQELVHQALDELAGKGKA